MNTSSQCKHIFAAYRNCVSALENARAQLDRLVEDSTTAIDPICGERVVESIESLELLLDTHNLKLRDRIAKKIGATYVGPISEEGIMMVQLAEETRYYKKNCSSVSTFSFQKYNCTDFVNGFACVKCQGDSSYYALTTKGHLLSDPGTGESIKNRKPFFFQDEVALLEDDTQRHFFYVDSSGRKLKTTEGESYFEKAYPFTDGFGLVRLINDNYQFIDINGQFAGDEYSMATPFSNGLACVKKKGLFHILTKQMTIIPVGSQRMFEFSDGVAHVMIDENLHKFIYPDGSRADVLNKEAWNANNVESFHEGLALYGVGGGQGYLRKDGVHLYNPDWMKCSEPIHGMGIVTLHTGMNRIVKRDGSYLENADGIVEYSEIRNGGSMRDGQAFFIVTRSKPQGRTFIRADGTFLIDDPKKRWGSASAIGRWTGITIYPFSDGVAKMSDGSYIEYKHGKKIFSEQQ